MTDPDELGAAVDDATAPVSDRVWGPMLAGWFDDNPPPADEVVDRMRENGLEDPEL